MVFSSMSNYNLNPTSNWNHQQQAVNHHQLGSSSTEVHHPHPPHRPFFHPPPPSQPPPVMIQHQGIIRPGSMTDQARIANMPIPETVLKCPRCASMNTKFCYYNNYSLSQPRYFCKNCRRYWTQGGALRNVPVGGGCRRNKRSSSKGGGGSSSTRSKSPAHSSSTTPSNSSGCSTGHLIRHGSQIQPAISLMNHLSDYSIADIGASYPGLTLTPQASACSPDQFNLLAGNVNTNHSISGMDPWRYIQQQQQLVQQYHYPSGIFDGNLEVPLRRTTLLYGLESHVHAGESAKHKLSSPTTTAGGRDSQLDLLKVEKSISSFDSGIGQRPHQHILELQPEANQAHQYNWCGGSDQNRNTDINSSNSSSKAPAIAWTDLISGFSSSSSTTPLSSLLMNSQEKQN